MKRKEDKPVTQEELTQAIRRFLDAGGIIHKLPEAKSTSRRRVGAHWNTSELGSDLSE